MSYWLVDSDSDIETNTQAESSNRVVILSFGQTQRREQGYRNVIQVLVLKRR